MFIFNLSNNDVMYTSHAAAMASYIKGITEEYDRLLDQKCYKAKLYVRHTATERTVNTRVCSAAAVEEFGHAKLSSGLVRLEVNVLKPTPTLHP